MGYPTKPTHPLELPKKAARGASIFRDSCLWNQSSRQQHLNTHGCEPPGCEPSAYCPASDEQLPPKAASSLVVFSSFMMRKECWKGQASRVAEWVYIVELLSYTVISYTCIPHVSPKKSWPGSRIKWTLGDASKPCWFSRPWPFFASSIIQPKKNTTYL